MEHTHPEGSRNWRRESLEIISHGIFSVRTEEALVLKVVRICGAVLRVRRKIFFSTTFFEAHSGTYGGPCIRPLVLSHCLTEVSDSVEWEKRMSSRSTPSPMRYVDPNRFPFSGD